MADRLGIDNQQQRLLGTNRPVQSAPRQTRSYRPDDTVIVVNASEKRYLWTARAFAVIVAISLCCNFVLILAITQLMPLYRIEPFLLTFANKEEQVYDIQPLPKMAEKKAITEIFVREYVLLRSSIINDITEMEARWMPGSQLEEMSSASVYQNFIQRTANKAFDIIRKKGLIRSVHIRTINELGRGIWQVEYETQDLYPDAAAPQVEYWTASLVVGYRKKTVKYGERLKNPTGFTVVKYNLEHNKKAE
jgi:type IV secretory pathway component VirB8